MFTRFLYTILLLVTVTISPAISQEEKTGGISERISIYMPIFEPPNCTTFLTEFGKSKKLIKQYSQSIGINFFSTMKLPNLEGIYVDMYSDPENITASDGEVLSDYVLYSFIYNEDGEYFSFGFNTRLKSPELAQSLYKSLLQNVGGKTSQKSYTTVVTCKETKKERMVVIKMEGSSVTWVVLDYSALVRMAIDGSKI